MSKLKVILGRLRNEPGFVRNVVAVSICLAVALVSSTYMLSKQGASNPFAQRFEFVGTFDAAPGVRPESRQEVRIAGVTVGRISKAAVDEHGRALLTLSIEPGHTIYTNAHLVLRAKSPLNPMYVTVDPGGPPAAPLAEGQAIPASQTDRAVQSYEVLDAIDGRTQAAITVLLNNLDIALADAPKTLPPAIDTVTVAAATYKPLLQKLAARRTAIRQLVGSLSQMSAAVGDNDQRLARTVGNLQTTLAVLGDQGSDLGATLRRLPGLTKNLNTAMAATHGLTGQLDPALDNLSDASTRLPGTLKSLTSTVQNAGALASVGRPVIAAAVPVLADLRPFVIATDRALDDLVPVFGYLPSASARIVPWMQDLAAFVYQTSSAFSIQDANGGMGRANVNLDLTNPTGGLADQGIRGGVN